MSRERDDLGVPAPLGAVNLGCRNCRPREPGLYCWLCPVSRRRRGGCLCVGQGCCVCPESESPGGTGR